jgi:hypothetical protein
MVRSHESTSWLSTRSRHRKHQRAKVLSVIAMTDIDLDKAEVRRERLVHIDQMLADHDRRRQEIKYAPWLAIFTGMATGAALFAAGGAFIKLMGG